MASERIPRAVDDLDETIKIIRPAVLGLRSRDDDAAPGLRSRAVRAIGEAAPRWASPPVSVWRHVPGRTADHVMAVLPKSHGKQVRLMVTDTVLRVT